MNSFLMSCMYVSRNFRYCFAGFSSFIRNNPSAAARYVANRVLMRLGFPRLIGLYVCPSHDCNADCVHCYEKFIHDKFQKGLSTQQIKDIIGQFCSLGGCILQFCSGEFLLRPDALELVRYAGSRDLSVSITTNGLLLDEKMAEELKKAGLWRLVVSIDSADASEHDELRRVKGCFEKATAGIRIAREKGIHTVIWTYISRTNFNAVEGVVELARRLGVNAMVTLPVLSGHFFHNFEENLSYEEKEELRRRFNNSPYVALEFPSENDICRGGGHTHICVMPSGDVTYCPPVPYSYGNIFSKSLKDCLLDVRKDAARFSHCRGQCIVNFPEYRKKCNARFMYE
ncbi:MAG TPA: radical SAM protein [Patescibacteria group bacterium]|nr:radical SAM protein [Patescibacteria group bacterium]